MPSSVHAELDALQALVNRALAVKTMQQAAAWKPSRTQRKATRRKAMPSRPTSVTIGLAVALVSSLAFTFIALSHHIA